MIDWNNLLQLGKNGVTSISEKKIKKKKLYLISNKRKY